uniref:Sulfotransferase n=1 Tax=Watasenia scintillans TaxID=6625 RepID=A0A3T0XDC1_WATSC|nr:sulfotransferase [Watasenia scintillans]
MPEVFKKDPDGHELLSFDYNGFLVPPWENVGERLDKLPDMTLRNDDAILLSYMKSGCHWVWEISNMLRRGHCEYEPNLKDVVMLELSDQSEVDLQPSPRVLNSHMMFEHLPRDMLAKRTKMIFVMRNPRDIVVSSYHHIYQMKDFYKYDGNWNGYFDLYMKGQVNYGKWFDYMLEWEKFFKSHPDYPVLFIKYEDMKKDPIGKIGELAEFFGLEKNEAFFKEVAEKCSFNKMKQHKALDKELFRTPGATLYRKGVVGDWKNWFTVRQNELFEEEYSKFKKKTEMFNVFD